MEMALLSRAVYKHLAYIYLAQRQAQRHGNTSLYGRQRTLPHKGGADLEIGIKSLSAFHAVLNYFCRPTDIKWQ